MARSRTIEAQSHLAEAPVASVPGGFGAEFRELARQRRFTPEGEPATATGRAPASQPPTSQPRQAASARPPAVPVPRSAGSPRMSEDHRAMLAELARMSDRLVESREALARALARAEHAESNLASANDRLMAARALVHDAQQATRASAERCAWLEGRCETLHEALDIAVNASIVTRWKWRRQSRAAANR